MKAQQTAVDNLLQSRQQPLYSGQNSSGDCILYVMSRDQRVTDNHALYIAQQKALELKVPLVVVFNLSPKVGVRAREHYEFMLDGLEQVARDLQAIGIAYIMLFGNPVDTIPGLCRQLKPAHVFFDFSPMQAVRNVQKTIANTISASCTVVDTHNIVPAWVTSDKLEFAAHTIRRKLHKHLEPYLVEPERLAHHPFSLKVKVSTLSFEQARASISVIAPAGIEHSYESGERAAIKHLHRFIESGLQEYAHTRNNVAQDGQSGLSPYLHFGQISSLRVALEVLTNANAVPLLFREPRMASAGEVPSREDGMNALFEEMIVRKELSDNFCMHTDNVKALRTAPRWANETLNAHAHDNREHLYTLEELEHCKTHDTIWNAAQSQLTKTGKMHGYMRMYWAKKMLEWTPDAQTAIDYAVYLNDHYSLDGGDPNGYAGILWSIAGLHDRPWQERQIFGKVRYMNAAGLKRKFDIDSYVAMWG